MTLSSLIRNIKFASKRSKNFLTKIRQTQSFVRNVQNNTINTLQGPLCTAENILSYPSPNLGSPFSQTVSEAQRRAIPDNTPSFRNWQYKTTVSRNLEVLYVPNYLKLLYPKSLHSPLSNSTCIFSNSAIRFFNLLKKNSLLTIKNLSPDFSWLKFTPLEMAFSQLQFSRLPTAELFKMPLDIDTRNRNFIWVRSCSVASTQVRDSAGYNGLLLYLLMFNFSYTPHLTFPYHVKLIYPKIVVCQNWVTSMSTLKTSLSVFRIVRPVDGLEEVEIYDAYCSCLSHISSGLLVGLPGEPINNTCRPINIDRGQKGLALICTTSQGNTTDLFLVYCLERPNHNISVNSPISFLPTLTLSLMGLIFLIFTLIYLFNKLCKTYSEIYLKMIILRDFNTCLYNTKNINQD